MLIRPVEGRLVRDPLTLLPLPKEGVEVPDYDPHWSTMLRFGDVERCDAPAESKAAPEPA